MSDAICATYAAGTNSLNTAKGSVAGGDFLNDCVLPGQPNGYNNSFPSTTAGSFNNDWTNGYLTQTKTPIYSSGLLSFGRTGSQS